MIAAARATPTVDEESRLAARWDPFPVVAVIGAAALLLIAAAYTAGRGSQSWSGGAFWAGFLILVIPAAIRLVGGAASRNERLLTVTALGVALYLVKVLHDPVAFTQFDEFHHWRTAIDILDTSHLFHPNNILQASPFYPGLEIVTTALVKAGGLSVFDAGTIVLGAARVMFVVALFLFFEVTSRSARLAGIATLVYMANPGFVFFDAQYAYESLALPFAAVALWAVVARDAVDRRALLGVTAVLLVAIAAVVVTHHVTSFALSVALVFWAVFAWIRARLAHAAPPAMATRDVVASIRGRLTMHHLGPGTPALLAVVATVGWLLYVGSVTVGYLAPHLGNAASEVLRFITGDLSSRQFFQPSGGEVTPIWEQMVGYGSVALVLLGLVIGGLAVWRRRDSTPILTLGIASLAYPATLALRLTATGAELSARLSEFVFVAVGMTIAVGVVVMEGGRRLRVTRPGIVGAAAVLLTGGTILGYPLWARVPGPYLVGADTRSVEPEGIAAAAWTDRYLGPDHRFFVDRSNRVLLATYGRQHAITSGSDHVNMISVLFAKRLGQVQLNILRDGHVEYALMDQRLASALPVLGVYMERGELVGGTRKTPVSPSAMQKFDQAWWASRIFDSGDIQIYDVRALTDAP